MRLWRRVYDERRRVVLPLVLLLVVNVAVLAIGVFPLRRAVASAEQDAAEASVKLRDANLALKRARDADGAKKRADVELAKFYTDILPASLSGSKGAVRLASFWLQKVAADANVQFKSATAFTQERVKDSQLIRYSGQITLNGDYANFRKFLYEVETSQEFVIIEKVQISQPALAQGPGTLEIELDVSTYFLGPPVTQ